MSIPDSFERFTMTRPSWTMIRDALAADIDKGTLGPGDRLPTEPELATRFGAGRHSVRRAVHALAREGKVSVEQGRGTFIEASPLLTYAIGKRTRLRQNLVPQGLEVSGDLLGAGLVTAKGRVRRALGLEAGSQVVESRRVTFANQVPIAFGSSYHDARRFPDFVERRDLLGSTTETYASYGIEDYVRGETTMHVRLAKPTEAEVLRQHADLPVIVVRALDREPGGEPLSFSEVVWAGNRVQFTMTGQDALAGRDALACQDDRGRQGDRGGQGDG